jgi:hypothetical protein
VLIIVSVGGLGSIAVVRCGDSDRGQRRRGQYCAPELGAFLIYLVTVVC